MSALIFTDPHFHAYPSFAKLDRTTSRSRPSP